MVRKMSFAKKITIGAMTCALTLLALYAASILPMGKLVCYFLSSVFVYTIVCENAYMTAVTSFIAVAALAFLLIPEKTVFYGYVLLLGHYGIFKTFIDTRVPDKVLAFFIKLLYCNIFSSIGIYLALAVVKLDIKNMLPEIPLWLLILATETAFILYDVLYSISQRIYVARIRGFILSGR